MESNIDFHIFGTYVVVSELFHLKLHVDCSPKLLRRQINMIIMNSSYFPSDKTLCDSCSFELECYEVNATCMGGQCLCSDSQYVSRCGICKMRKSWCIILN